MKSAPGLRGLYPRPERRGFTPLSVKIDGAVISVGDRVLIEMHRGILKGDRLEFRLFQLLRVIRQFRLIGRRDGANHVAR